MKDNAKGNISEVHSMLDLALRSFRVNGVAAVASFNIIMGLKQFPSFVAGMAEIGELNAIKGLAKFSYDPKKTEELYKKYAPQMYRRSFEREVAEMRELKSLEKRLKGELSPREVMIFLTRTLDKYAVGGLWQGGFDFFSQQYPNNLQKAGELATRVIRRTQPYFEIKDLPDAYRQSGELGKSILTFTNQLNNYFNYLKYDIVGKTIAKEQGIGKAMKKFIYGIILPALFVATIANSRAPKNIKEALSMTGKQLLGIIPVIGKVLTSALEGFNNVDLIAFQGLKSLGTATTKAVKGKYKESVIPALEAVGYTLGIPTTQPKRTIQGIIDLIKGNTDDWWRLIYSEYTRKEKLITGTPTSDYDTGDEDDSGIDFDFDFDFGFDFDF